jgi:hypothetical protein
MSEKRKFQCTGCGDWFEFSGRKPKYCPECRRVADNVANKKYKKKSRLINCRAKGKREEDFRGNNDFLEQVGGTRLKDVAAKLGIDLKQVHELERQALQKIRSNPELKELWDILRDELAGGKLEPGSLVIGSINIGQMLLDYQLAVAEWTGKYETFTDAGLTDEACECLVEIQLFRQKIAETLLLEADDRRQ